MGRVSTDRKVYMEREEEEDLSIAASSSPFSILDNNNNNSSSERGSSTLRSGLNKLSALNVSNRKKALTKLGSHLDYEQLLEEQQPLSSDTKHAGSGIFSAHSGSNSFGGSCKTPYANESPSVVRTDEPSKLGEEPSTSNSVNCVGARPISGGPRQSSVHLPAEHVVNDQLPSCPHEPLLKELDSFDDGDDGDEHFNRMKTVGSSPSAATATAGSQVNCVSRSARGPSRFGFTERSGGATNNTSSNETQRKAKSFDFGTVVHEDPPTKLIEAFLRKQAESGSNFLDVDLNMEEMTPLSKLNNGSVSPRRSDGEEKTLSPERNLCVKDTSYQDLVSLDPPVTNSVPVSLTAGALRATSAEELRRWKVQLSKDEYQCHSNPLSFTQEGVQDVRINVDGVEQVAKGKEESPIAATIRSPSPENGIGAQDSPTGVRWRRTSTLRPSSSPPKTSAEEEVVKAPAYNFVKPSFSKQKSRLADRPKPPEISKASGPYDENKLKSGQVRNSRELKSGLVGNKLKKLQEEEEEDPLKVTDLPEQYRSRAKDFWTIFQCVALLCIVGALICVLCFPTLKRKELAGLALWKWVLLVMVMFSGRLISGWIVWVVVFIIEKNFLLRKKVVYFVYALRRSVKNCLWLGLALLAWHYMVDPKVSYRKAVTYVTKILVCFLVAAFIVLLKTLLVKVFASSFHVTNYFERIQEALFNQYIVETLGSEPLVEYEQELDEEKRMIDEIAELRDAGATGPSLSRVPNLPPLGRASGLPPRPSVGTKSGMIGSQQQKSAMIGRSPKVDLRKKKSSTTAELKEGISVDVLQKLDLSNISAWNMKKLIHIIRNSTLTHSLEETVNAAEGETEITSEWQAKLAAKQIFKNVAKPGNSVIMEDDLLRFMREDEVKKALTHFDGAAETKCITKQALKKWVIDVYKERRALALSLNDTKTAVNKLHRMADVLVGIIIIVIWLLLLNIATTKLLLFLSSEMLLLILVWGNTLKTAFEAIVFLFVMHPFDVGDRCVIDGMQLVVEEMNILTTVFLGDCNVKIWFPNSVLATKPIQNYYRSPEMGDGVEFIVQACTPVKKIADFKEKIGVYIKSKPSHWHPDYGLNVVQMAEGEKMKLALGVKHTMNYQDMGEIVKRRSELLLEVKFCMQELGIEYHIPPQEFHIRQRTD